MSLATHSSSVIMCFRLISLVAMIMLSGCARYGVVANTPIMQVADGKGYRMSNQQRQRPVGDVLIILAFSGGGTRAAALSYGVLQALRDTRVDIDGREVRLLDEVDRISSVSGGSFTSAYYGLYGDRIFQDYEQLFLKKDVQGALTLQVINPFDIVRRIISRESHSEIAVRYYDRHLFHGATFADFKRDGPFILINASDLEAGEQFVFLQGNFDFLCSDLDAFKVARAVAASSSVPVVFDPIVLDNHAGCGVTKPGWLLQEESISKDNIRLKPVIRTIDGYLDKEKRHYIHLIDGGITDNLGLRSLYTGLSAMGVKRVSRLVIHGIPRHVVIVVVDASTDKESGVGLSRKAPSIAQTISSVTNAQLSRYNTETIELIRRSMVEWEQEMTTPEKPVSTHFVRVSLNDIEDPVERRFFHEIPTSFSLTDEQVDRLIEMGGKLLRQDPEYRGLLEKLNADNTL